MTSSNLDAASLFRVDGMVAVVTGGGTGTHLLSQKTPLSRYQIVSQSTDSHQASA
jgi:hypothetical protein